MCSGHRAGCRVPAQFPRARADHRPMVIGLVFLLCLASVPLAGGRIGALAELRFRARGVLFASIVAQILIISVVPAGFSTLHDAVHIGTYVAVAAFVVANRRIPWVWLVALGGALNFAAIAANGGIMPATPGALKAAGMGGDQRGFTTSRAGAPRGGRGGAWSSPGPTSPTPARSPTRTCSSWATSSGCRARGR